MSATFLMFGLFLVFLICFFSGSFLGKQSGSAEIDIEISLVVKDSTKTSMTKNVFDGRVETTLTTEKGACFRRNTVDVWKNFGFFKMQACDFSLEKADMPDMTTFC